MTQARMKSRMDRKVSQQRSIALEGVSTVSCPTVACLLTALVVCGPRAVLPASPAFQVVVNGFIVGVLTFAAGRWRGAGLCTAATLLTVSMLAFASEASTRIAAHTIILMAALTGMTFVSTRLLAHRSESGHFVTFLIWAGVSAAFYLLTGMTLVVVFRATDLSVYLRLYARLSVALGLGLGLGFAMRDWFGSLMVGKVARFERHQQHGDGRR